MANLSSTTWKQVDAQARALSGATDYSNPNATTQMRYGNLVLQKIARLLAPIQKPWGRTTASLTNTKALGYVGYIAGGAEYNHSTKTLSGVSGLDQTYVGGWAFLMHMGESRGYIGLIDTVAAAGTSAVMRMTLMTSAAPSIDPIVTGSLLAILKPNPVFYSGANLGSVNIFDVVKVVDATNGNAVRLSSKEFASFLNNPNYDGSVVIEYAGESIYFGKGSSVSAYGSLTMTYDEKPTVITAATDTIDLPEEYIGMMVEELIRWDLNHISRPIPEQWEHPLKALEAEYKRNRKENLIKTRQLYRVAERGGR
jgi:hypothetical protein